MEPGLESRARGRQLDGGADERRAARTQSEQTEGVWRAPTCRSCPNQYRSRLPWSVDDFFTGRQAFKQNSCSLASEGARGRVRVVRN